MRAKGVIIDVSDGYASVVVLRESACAGCGAACASCHKAVRHTVRLDNTIGGAVGEEVWIESSGKYLLWFCFVLFIVPAILGGAFCAFVWNKTTELMASGLTFGVFCLCFALLYLTVGKVILAKTEYRLVKKY